MQLYKLLCTWKFRAAGLQLDRNRIHEQAV